MKEILKILYDKFEKELDSLKNRGITFLEEKVYYKTSVTFKEWTKTTKNTSTEFEEIIEQGINWLVFYKFVSTDIKRLPEFNKCLSDMIGKYEISGKTGEWILERFLQVIAPHILNGVTEEQKQMDITKFLEDMNREPPNWQVKEYCNGIWIEEQVHLNEITLRKPLPGDYEKTTLREDIPFSPILEQIDLCDFVIEFTTKSVSDMKIQNIVSSTILYLKLYKLGSIYPVYGVRSPDSFIMFASSGKRNTFGYSTSFSYTLNKEDENKINLFIKKLETLSKSKDLLETINNSKPLSIAFGFFNSALLEAKSVEHRITNTISCLEALYLSGASGELKRRLSQRVAVILKYFGFSPTKVFDDVKTAYDIRSKYVHGDSLNKKQESKAVEIIEDIVQYSRISFLVFLQMKNQYSKKKLLETIDQALLDEEISKNLLDRISTQCFVYI